MTFKDHLCCLGYGLQARYTGLHHLIRGHKLHWRDDIDLWWGITGTIWCEDCPDTGGNSLAIWTRDWDWIWWIAKCVCGLLGHPSWHHPQRWNGQEPVDDDSNMIDVTDELCCSRCLAWRKL